jgi:hypothetical protein
VRTDADQAVASVIAPSVVEEPVAAKAVEAEEGVAEGEEAAASEESGET